nr:hypothetical protein [Tanacetum cinerariifolium]
MIVNFLKASYIRIETTDQETKIIATVDGKSQTISESSLRRHLKLNDEEGISSLPNAELFENLSLMGYNILPNQSRNIGTAVVCLATNRVYNFSKIIFDGMMRNMNSKSTKFLIYPRKVFTTLRVNSPSFSGRTVPLFASMIVTQGEGSANPTEPHHTPSPQEHLSPQSDHLPQHDSPPLSHQIIIPEPISHDLQAPTATLTPRRLTKRAIRIAQSKALSPDANEPASLSRDDRQGEAFPTVSRLDTGQDRDNIAKTSVMPHESSPRVPSLDADEGSAIVSTASVSPATVGVPTVSGSFPTPMRIPVISAKDKGKEKVAETEVPKKKKLQEQIDAQVAREMEEEFARENQRLSEQVARDYEIVRIHDEEELKMIIEGLDRSNEVIAKHLSEYEQAKADLSVGEKIELISKLVKYQDHRAKILKYQAQQSKPLSKKEQWEFYMSVLKSHDGWKTKHFRGTTLEQSKEKFIPVWKQMEDFVPMSSMEESERVKRLGIKLDQRSLKRVKISHTSRPEPAQEQQFKGSKGVFGEELKGMMQLVPLEEVYIEALHVKHSIIDWDIHSEGKREY